MALYHVAVTGRDRRHLSALGGKLRVVVVSYRETTRGIVVDAYVPEEKIGWLERHGYAVTRLEKNDGLARQRQVEGRKAVDQRLKKGRYGDVIWGGGYLTTEEVEAAIELGERNHGAYFQRIPLPNLTWEKRRSHAVRIGKGNGKRRPAVCFTGGVHGREWGSSDILVYFAMRVLRAYRDRSAIRLGSKLFTAAQIRDIVDNLDVVLFPLVNPDGRKFSMEHSPMWRKNRRPAPRGRSARCIGVDLNRNFPFLWDFDKRFAPGTVESTRNPADYETYIGTREASEPETRNVIWLLDRFPNIRFLMDLHSYGETILHSWGSDQNQYEDPRMNFRNQAFDGKRGLIHDDGYREHMPRADEKIAVTMGRSMAAAIERVRGRKYKVAQSVGLYPTAASTDDYAYSRHLVDPRKGKIIAFTMEWGRSRAVTPFHPPYPEMRKVMREVTAGLIECCLRARAR